MKKKEKLAWSKMLLLILFINFFILEIFIGAITVYSFFVALAIGVMPELTPLVALIGAVIGETISYGIYAAKAKAENIEGGVEYEMAIRQFERDNNIEEGGNIDG